MNLMHPTLGTLLPLTQQDQPGKVWRHLHSPTEDWSALVGTDTARLHSAARAWGCPQWRADGAYPSFRPACAERLRAQHDRYWVGVYGPLLVDPAARCARSARDNRWAILAPRGVYAVVLSNTPARVITVYRPHPPGLNVCPAEEDFVFFAERKWSRETGMAATQLFSELERRSPDPIGVWRLALAVGAAEAHPEPEIRSASTLAELWLAELPPTVRAAAIPDRSKLLDALEGILREAEVEVAGTLFDLEDAMVVTGVLAGAPARDALLDSLGQLLEWSPQSWSGLADIATERIAEGPHWVRTFWEKVADSVSTAVFQGMPALHRPMATLTESVLAPPWWSRWARKLSLAPERASSLSASEAGWMLAAARLSGDGSVWDVVPPKDVIEGRPRVFVVHSGAPMGEEVTTDLGAGQALWELEHPGDEIRVMLLEGTSGATLSECVEAALSGAGGRLTVVEISRPK